MAYIPSDKHETGLVVFEFQMKYHEPLTNHWTLQECISSAVNAVMIEYERDLSLSITEINISSIDLKPNETKPRLMRIEGNFRCKVMQKDMFITALKVAHESRKISSQFARKTKVSKLKVGTRQFIIKWTDSQIIDDSIIENTHKNFEIHRKRSLSYSAQSHDENEPDDDDDPFDEHKMDPEDMSIGNSSIGNCSIITPPPPGHDCKSESMESIESLDLRTVDPFYSINLYDLVDAHSVCQYIRQFPKIREKYIGISNDHNNRHDLITDNEVCSKLSVMIYQQQLNGSFFAQSFTKNDFEDLMNLTLKSSVNLWAYQHQWIWGILSKAIEYSNEPKKEKKVKSTNSEPDTSTAPSTMSWILSSWQRHGILQHQIQRTSPPQPVKRTNSYRRRKRNKPDGLVLVEHDEKTESLSPSSPIHHARRASNPMDYGVTTLGAPSDTNTMSRSMDFNAFGPVRSPSSIMPMISYTTVPNEHEFDCLIDSPAMKPVPAPTIATIAPRYMRQDTDAVHQMLLMDATSGMAIIE